MSQAAPMMDKRVRVEDNGLLPIKREPSQNESVGAGRYATLWARGEVGEQESTGDEINNDKEFWFDDGTVILVARDAEFRVCKRFLASLSPLFKGLFAQPHVHRPTSIGGRQTLACPVVRLSDSPEDLRRLFRVCFTKRPGRSLPVDALQRKSGATSQYATSSNF